jgi:hypothetical protein
MHPRYILKDTPVDYDDPSHRYYLGNRVYRSASQIVGRCVEPFDVEERSRHMAFKYGRTPAYWQQKWRDINTRSLVRGSGIHDAQEQFLYNQGFDYIDGKRQPVHQLREVGGALSVLLGGMRALTLLGRGQVYHRYEMLPDGIYPELKLWRHDWGIAGRSDKVTLDTVGGVRVAHVEDYKTNAKIARRSLWEKFLLPPLSQLEECEFNEYALQLSLYMFMLEYFGFTPGRIRLIHFPHPIEGLPGVPDPVVLDVPYLRDDVLRLLAHLQQQGWLEGAAA